MLSRLASSHFKLGTNTTSGRRAGRGSEHAIGTLSREEDLPNSSENGEELPESGVEKELRLNKYPIGRKLRLKN